MSENSERKGMVWARWYEGQVWHEGVGDLDDLKRAFDAAVEMRLDDERRALVRAALTGYRSRVAGARTESCDVAVYCEQDADAVLARYDREVGE